MEDSSSRAALEDETTSQSEGKALEKGHSNRKPLVLWSGEVCRRTMQRG